MNQMHYVYRHIRPDTGEVFYVGKGKVKIRFKKPFLDRMTVEHKNSHWQRIVAKHGVIHEVICLCWSDEEAQAKEKFFIAQYGRRDLGRGTLVNFTDGGDGHCGILTSEELRKKRSEWSKGKRPDAWVASIRRARKNGGNGGVVKFGDKLPDQWRARIALTKFGSRNPMFGRTGSQHHRSRRVSNIKTGEEFSSVREAAESSGMEMKTLYNMLTGHRTNRTDLRFK